jgi:hypothetical protein
MIETITPVVHGRRRSRYWTTVALHALGASLAAGALGIALGAVGALLGAPWGGAGLAAVAAVALAYAARELLHLPLPLPDRKRQVPEWWRTFFSPRVAAFLYGLGLGIGFLTFLSYGTFVAIAAGALASGDPLTGALLCTPFGMARGLSVAVGSATGAPGGAGRVVDRLEAVASGGAPRAVNGLVLAAIALVAASAG